MLLRLHRGGDTGNKDGFLDLDVSRQLILMALKGWMNLKPTRRLAVELNLPILAAFAILCWLHSIFLKRSLQRARSSAVAETDSPQHLLAQKRAKDRFNVARALGRDPAPAVSQAGAHGQIRIRNDIRGQFIHMARPGEHMVQPECGFWGFLGNGRNVHHLLLGRWFIV